MRRYIFSLPISGSLSSVTSEPVTRRAQHRQVDVATEDYDFTIGSLAFQARYRYEFAPLSELFIVYSRGGYQEGGSDAGAFPGFSDIWSGSKDEITADQILIKLRYRLTL